MDGYAFFIRTHEKQAWYIPTCAARSSEINSVKLWFLAGSESCMTRDWILVFSIFSLNRNSKTSYTMW